MTHTQKPSPYSATRGDELSAATAGGHAPLRRLAPAAERERVIEALRDIARGSDSGSWLVHRLAAGKQAKLFTVRAPGARPVWEGHSEVVVKLYYSDLPRDRAALEDGFQSLHQLHALLDGTTVRGWHVRCPLPLLRCERPLAVVMTAVPGRTINSCLASRRRPSADVLESLAHASVDALERYWAGDLRPYGDPNLKNILFDEETRTLSLVDPGLPEEIYRCDDAPNRWYPASRDLAFLIYWTAVTVKSSLGRPGFQRRREQFAASMLRSAVCRQGSRAQQESFLDEIEACIRVHLRRIPVSYSPAGLWRRFVKAAATRTIRAILQEQKATRREDVPSRFSALAVNGAAAPAGRLAAEPQRVSA